MQGPLPHRITFEKTRVAAFPPPGGSLRMESLCYRKNFSNSSLINWCVRRTLRKTFRNGLRMAAADR